MSKRAVLWLALVGVLGILAGGCGSAAVRYVSYRVSPDRVATEGEVRVPVQGLPGPVKIYLDPYAIPHIQAGDEYSLYYAFGYIQGRDRRFQLETLKMAAAGRLRELIGDRDESGVMTRLEIFSRMIGLYKDAEALLADISPQDRRLLQAYADGINEATRREPLPMEFRLLGYQPEPWTTTDTGLVIAMIRFGLCKNWELELSRLEFLIYQVQTNATLDRALRVWPPRYDLGPHLIGEKPAQDPFAGIPPVATELQEFLADYAKQYPLKVTANPPAPVSESPWDGWGRGFSCSNNWAVDGVWTGTGKAAFCGDPHMPHFLPSLGYLAHLKCDNCEAGSYEVIGGAFVGLPAIAFGTNGHTAWGPTSNWADVTDVYVEKLVPDKPGHYYYQGQAVPFETREEVFKIRLKNGQFREERHQVRTTRHGVVINDFMDRLPPEFPIVVLRRDYEWGKPISALRNLYLSRNVTEARTALLDFTAMIGHWSLADDGGNLLYVGSVRLPKRTRHLGTIPVPGWTGTYEWESFYSPAELPWILNPPQHFLGTANNQVIQPESFAAPIALDGDVPQRIGRIWQVLGAGNDGRPIVEQMADLQRDNMDLGWLQVKPLYTQALAPLFKDNDPVVAKAAKALSAWDGHAGPNETGSSLFQTLNAFILENTLADEMRPESLSFILGFFNAEPFVFNIFADPENPAWDDRRTERRETAAEVIAASFRDAVKALVENYGEEVDDWKWTTVAPFVLKHNFGDQKVLAGYLNRGPLPTDGTGNGVNKHQFMRSEMWRFPIKYGPVLRVNADLNDLAASRMCLPGGQSGRPSSNHYDDLLPLWLKGQGASMKLGFADWEKNATGVLILEPEK